MAEISASQSSQTGARYAFLWLLVGAAAISFAPILVRLSELGPTPTAFYRTFLALPFLGLWLWQSTKRSTKQQGAAPVALSRGEYVRLALAGFFFAGDLTLWHYSIYFTSIANSTLLANLAPIFVTLGGFLLFRERFTRLFLGGMALALVGVAVLMGESFQLSGRSFFGDFLGVLTAVFYASYILSVGRLRARLATVVLMFWSTLATTVFLVPVVMLSGDAMVPPSAQAWATLLALALMGQVLGQSLIAYALAHLPAAFSSVSLMFQPVLAALVAWILFAEALSAFQGLGALVVMVGVVAARQGSLRTHGVPKDIVKSAERS